LATDAIVGGHDAGTNSASGSPQTFVDHAVAVIVNTIADFYDVHGEVVDAFVDWLVAAIGIAAE
jgi:hypothetical protein